MNRESNTYTIVYASVMVIIVAVALAFTHQVLKDRQIKNENIDKMQQILRSLRLDVPANAAEAKYNAVIKNAYLINPDGAVVEGSEGVSVNDPAFEADIAKDDSKGLPVFEAEIEGKTKIVIPMAGKGLWGAIWGYLAVDADGSSVYGADFSHAGETPGLGAEIVSSRFCNQFEGKHLFRDEQFTSVAVVKPGRSVSDRDYVDGISGGTITSKGVDNMLLESVGKYKVFFRELYSAQ
ncbi:MAG: NADH:ubiquinone reductase (Na(+)-transporting) subunit C [Dysgonamonadaceae bacterium]|jgi:Na+-transporting NADH:ubiquinone oxidoreductase subunit C|nr:NADH:ubiquinone reductase (Na(+)-transporting) subunit C [Dysgonamonadaceae bacterium]